MSLVAECPVCRRPLRWTYVLRHAWSQWRCHYCGSLLEIDRKRRFLAVLPFIALVLTGVYLASHAGWGDYSAAIIAFALWLPFFLLVDRAVAVERRGFRCKTCGYDLQGQVTPRCPECGRHFDAEERAFLEGRAVPRSASGRRHATWIGIVIISMILLSTLVTGLLYFYTMTAANRRTAATQPAVPNPSSSQPTTSPVDETTS